MGQEGQRDRRSKQRESGEGTGREGGERDRRGGWESHGVDAGRTGGNESATAHYNYNVQELGQSSIHHSSS